jgi:hypothetical protein
MKPPRERGRDMGEDAAREQAMSESYFVYAILLALVLVQLLLLNGRIAAIEKQVGRTLHLDAKLDLLLKYSGLQYDPYKDLPPGVADALRNRQKVQAIKLYRAATGVGLKDAKDFVAEALRRAGDT